MSREGGDAPVVVLGAGNVGCGVVAEHLQAAGRPVVVVSGSSRSADLLRTGRVRVRLTGQGADGDTVLHPHHAVEVADAAAVVGHVREASVVVVATGPGAHRALAPVLAAGLSARTSPVNVLVCDNRRAAAEQLRAMVAEHGERDVLRHGYVGALVDRIVTRREEPDGNRVLLAEPEGTVHVDARALVAPLDAGGQLHLVESFAAYVMRKLYVFSAGHAASAYLGMQEGYGRLTDALADPGVSGVVRAAMHEGQAGIAACFGEHFAGGPDDVAATLRRFADPELDDTVERVGRDPGRKLGANDRICGAARLAVAAGEPTPALALVAAAALSTAAQDPRLREQVARLGEIGLLARVGRLAPHHPFLTSTTTAMGLLEAGCPVADAYPALRHASLGPHQSSPRLRAAG